MCIDETTAEAHRKLEGIFKIIGLEEILRCHSFIHSFTKHVFLSYAIQ